VTFGHVFFIPMTAMVGMLFGFVVGARAARNQLDLQRKRDAERIAVRAAREARKAAEATRATTAATTTAATTTPATASTAPLASTSAGPDDDEA
jgi:hypothetical protein